MPLHSVPGILSRRAAAGGWDLSNAAFVRSQDLSPDLSGGEGVFFRSDGTKLFMTDADADALLEFNVPSPFDISSASFVQSASISGDSSFPTGLFYRPNSFDLYVCATFGPSILRYSTASWSLSSVTLDQSLDVTGVIGNPYGVFIRRSDGAKLYVCGFAGFDVGQGVAEYDLSFAWDLSTATHVQTLDVSAQEATPTGIVFKPDGTKMFITGQDEDRVFEYDLGTAWDVSTATFVQSFDTSDQVTFLSGLFIDPDNGEHMYVISDFTSTLFQYSLSP